MKITFFFLHFYYGAETDCLVNNDVIVELQCITNHK